MLDISNPGRNAFREPPGSDTAQLQPMHSMPPLAGGIAYARIGSTWTLARAAVRVRDLNEILRVVSADKLMPTVKARCLGFRRGAAIEPCPHCKEATTIDELKAKHPSLYELKDRHEVHVFALYSDAPIATEEYKALHAAWTERTEELAELVKAKRYSEAQALRQQLGWGMRNPPAPVQDIVGLCITQEMSGGWDHVHPERVAR